MEGHECIQLRGLLSFFINHQQDSSHFMRMLSPIEWKLGGKRKFTTLLQLYKQIEKHCLGKRGFEDETFKSVGPILQETSTPTLETSHKEIFSSEVWTY